MDPLGFGKRKRQKEARELGSFIGNTIVLARTISDYRDAKEFESLQAENLRLKNALLKKEIEEK